MLKNYAVFPCKNIRITQNYSGSSHHTQPESTNGVKSYPLDVAYNGLKITAFADKVKSVKMNGFYNESVLNQVFFQSVDKVYMANGDYDYITILVGHADDWDYTQNQIGTIYDRYQEMLDMGYDGVTIQNTHSDIVVAKGKQSGWVQNSFGEWVLPNSMKFEDVFYIDPKFNNVIDTKGINFKTLPEDAYLTVPTPVLENRDVDQVKVVCGDNTLFVRTNHSTKDSSIGYAKPGLYNIISTYEDDTYVWYQVEEGKWFANAEGCTEYIYKYVAPIIEEPVIDVPKENDSNGEVEEPPIIDENKPVDEDNSQEPTNTSENTNESENAIKTIISDIISAIVDCINKIISYIVNNMKKGDKK